MLAGVQLGGNPDELWQKLNLVKQLKAEEPRFKP